MPNTQGPMPNSIFITGASRGIGLALSLVFAEKGWTVFAGARQPRTPLLWSAGQRLANLHPVALDVLDDASVGEAALQVGALAPVLDVLVNNAAIFPGEGQERLHELDLAWFAEAVDTNVAGVARVSRVFLPLLQKSAHPRIANISSGAASISDKEDYDHYAYAVSKAGLNMLTRAMAAEFRPDRIAVAAISPGWVLTEMGGPNAPLTPEESAQSLYGAITGLTLDRSGRFLDRDGSDTDYGW